MREKLQEWHPRLEALWLRLYGVLTRWLASVGRALEVMFSREGLPGLAYLLMVLSLGTGWVHTLMQGPLKPRAIPLLGAVDLADRSSRLFSAGTVLILILLYVWVTRPTARWASRIPRWLRRPAGWRSVAGAVVLLVPLAFLVSLTFTHTEVLDSMMDELRQLARIKAFDNSHVRGNVGVILIPELTDDTLAAQIAAVGNRTGLGIWFALVAGVLLLVQGYRELLRENPAGAPFLRRLHAALAGGLLLLFAALAAPAVIADSVRARADARAERGEYASAHELYRRARNLDPRLATNDSFLIAFGRTAHRLGEKDSPEARYYRARTHIEWRDFRNAIRELKEALATLEAQGRSRTLPAYRRKLVAALADMGKQHYGAQQYHAAARTWREGRSLAPDSLEFPYYLARAYYVTDGKDQERAIALNRYLLRRVRDRIFRSDLYCNLGEAYTASGQFAEARKVYERSLDMYNFVKDINYRAQRGMLGL